ncbi:hypothetical protein EDF31_10193 [Curtobacterium sp. PhB142]|uniref:DUF308 domain-containing protein n=1 Tax=unclassified Curtobacterium TaxID=257496 RepID=UPI000F4AEF1E|nr:MULTISPECIES: DUF308 domain-containing protein [unclassified Curtobacterium]MBF4604985.1 hypothetical protein [Curtobacterium sp. VKM Ac-2884]ROS36051.1 hypothetical protein EDF53_2016 [Curtobacterium sp. PhB78]RPE85027.1 hypothetical protein EDF28_0970 [Curtobacterium sp. PhB137]TCL88253.1 hypothetical protein EDF31_10193 [Curtobacterium sp. PhB142]TCM00077.1 hypothetical protein EDF26_11018 [Curtobacterium sp. PhB134]
MSDTVDDATTVNEATQRARYWPIPILRAVPAAVVALVITFSTNHAAGYGLLLFAGFALVEGLVLLWAGVARLPLDGRSRRTTLLQAVITLLAAVAGFAGNGLGLPAFISVIVAFAVLTGALELAQGLRARRRSPFARDWTTIGALTLLLAIAFLITPPDYSQQLGGVEQVTGTLDASIVLVGLLGAYLAITAVFHVIAGLSHKWGTATPAVAPDGAPHA